MADDLPAPEGPTSATDSPGNTERSTLLSDDREEFGYVSDTLLNWSFGVLVLGLSMLSDIFSSVLDDKDDVVDDFIGADAPPADIIVDWASRMVKMLLAAVFALAISGLRLKS